MSRTHPVPGDVASRSASANPLREIDRLGLPLWLTCVAVFVLTLLIGARLFYTTIRVGLRTRARRLKRQHGIGLVQVNNRGVRQLARVVHHRAFHAVAVAGV